MSSFVHRIPCEYGAKCRTIDDPSHNQEFEHPLYCRDGGSCCNTSNDHEKSFRHVPMCTDAHKCKKYRAHDKDHCSKMRHCKPRCQYAGYCADFHNRGHIEDFEHPFRTPCPFTPYHCAIYIRFEAAKDKTELSYDDQQHCETFAHICRFGRNCTYTDSFHLQQTVHIFRRCCRCDSQCTKCADEDHLKSFTHSHIRDIRFLCEDGNKCSLPDDAHLAEYRHPYSFDDASIVLYYNLNKDVNFVQNQHDNIERVLKYMKDKKWEQLPYKGISQDIIDWIRMARPVHRCKPNIFVSILLHGHVMSRDYMENLKKTENVVHSILQHNRIQKINNLKYEVYRDLAEKYINAIVMKIFTKNNSNNSSQSYDQIIQDQEGNLSQIVDSDELQIIKSTANEIAIDSLKLLANPTGIGYHRDKDLRTNRSIFSILGPNSGKYGDIFIVFKREILHHPDTNFSIQSATSYPSGNAFEWRPWLGVDPGTVERRIQLFHQTKLHASIPGYEYATALEMIAVTNTVANRKTMKVNLEAVLEEWTKLESHKRIEVHLPQLIPLDYIEHIYMRNDTFDSFDSATRDAIESTFGTNISLVEYESRESYENLISTRLITRFRQHGTQSFPRPVRGLVITLPSTKFEKHYVLPLTISQAFAEYKIDHPNISESITTYIYWQLMHGDMMLTLSNEPIDSSKKQSKLNCLICYLAEKPSTKDLSYHEKASYLNSGRPLEHYKLVDTNDYAAKSTTFYVGCDTDDLMTFCLEIQRSTGKVILSHFGPNLIYNKETISFTFDKNKLDLQQLDFIHVSAGVHTVPIRNLYVTFEKEPEPCDISCTTSENLQQNQIYYFIRNSAIDTYQRMPRFLSTSLTVSLQPQLIKYLIVYLLTIFVIISMSPKKSTNETNDSGSFSLWNFVLYIIRYGWMLILIVISEFPQTKGIFPEYARFYEDLQKVCNRWRADDNLKSGTIVIGILTGPFVLEKALLLLVIIFKFIMFVLWKPIIFMIRYEWLLIVIIIAEILSEKNNNACVRFYANIQRVCNRWCADDNLKSGTIVIGILYGPFVLEKALFLLIIILNFIMFVLWKLIIFMIRYEWLLIVIIIAEILSENNLCQYYISVYRTIKCQTDDWCGCNQIKRGIVTIFVLTVPYLWKLLTEKVLTSSSDIYSDN